MRELHILYAFVSKCGINYMHWIQYIKVYIQTEMQILRYVTDLANFNMQKSSVSKAQVFNASVNLELFGPYFVFKIVI